MKKLALALVCLVSVAFFASCDPTDIENAEPSIQVLSEDGYIQDGDVVDMGVTYTFGFVVASNTETNKELTSLVVKVGDVEWANVDLTGMTSYTYKDEVNWGLEKEIIGTDVITAVVTDAAGETNTATINVSVNEPAVMLEPYEFTWNRHGGNDGTGLEEFGLEWTKNEREIYAVITPMEGAQLFKFDTEVWENTTTDIEKAALFSETPLSLAQFKEVSCTAVDKDYDIVLGTVYNGEYNLIHVMHSHAYTFKGTDVTITGEAK